MKRLLCSGKEEERMLRKHFYLTLTVALALIVALLTVSPAFAITFTVNSTLDQPDDLTIPGVCHTAANTCTLRAAIMQANRAAGIARIMLPSGIYNLTIPAEGSGGEENGDLNLTTPATGTAFIYIIGSGAGTTIIDAGKIDRVFDVAKDRSAAIEGVTIRNGYAGDGGGIYNYGVLTVSDAVISGNKADLWGGGIYNFGTLTVMNSTISQNFAPNAGGGIHNDGFLHDVTLTVIDSTISRNATLTDGSAIVAEGILDLIRNGLGGGIFNHGQSNMLVTRSTISQNSSNFGGGIFQGSGTMTIVNSTISQNSAMTDGGGIYNGLGSVNVLNTSIVFNDADSDRDPNGGTGGGVFNGIDSLPNKPPPVFNLRNTLVAGNTVHNAPIYDDCYGNLGLYGSNLFSAVGAGCTVDGDWGTLGHWNPFSGTLGPLQNNGGPTWTHALMPGSNAIDGGDPLFGCVDFNGNAVATDQRGVVRPQGSRCDIGSYEFYASTNTALYFPHITTSIPWQTEIAIINISDRTVLGTLRALNDQGQLVETKDVILSVRGRRQITIADEFTNHTNIAYIVFYADSPAVQGYTKFYRTGYYRVAIPAVKEVSSSDIYIPHIAADADWWTGISLVNTTSAQKTLTIAFNNGQSRQITLAANQHWAFNIAQ